MLSSGLWAGSAGLSEPFLQACPPSYSYQLGQTTLMWVLPDPPVVLGSGHHPGVYLVMSLTDSIPPHVLWILPRKQPSSPPLPSLSWTAPTALSRSPLCRQFSKYRSHSLIHLLLQTLPNQVSILALAQAQIPASSLAAPIPAL